MTSDDEPQEPEDERAVVPSDEDVDSAGTAEMLAGMPPGLAEMITKLFEDAGDGAQVTKVQAGFAAMVASSGPLPDPAVLRQYNEIIPDGANRILKMAEEQSAHRISIEKTVMVSDSTRANLGLAAGLLVALTGLGVAALVILQGQPIAGVVFGAIDLFGLVSIFVYGTESRRRERREQRLSLTPPE